MNKKVVDWKDVADSYYDKAVSLAILILLFSFIVSPKIEVKPFKREIKVIESIDLTPEIKEKIKPPEETVKPVVVIVVEDDLEGDDDDDIDIVDTIEETTLDPYKEIITNKFGQTKKFIIYDVEPVPITQIPPEYPEFAKKAGIEGAVTLWVEVFTDGTVGAIEVKKTLMSGPGGLDEAAIDAVKRWKFSPAKSGGKPVAVWVVFDVNFNLN